MLRRVDRPAAFGSDNQVRIASSGGSVNFDQILAAARRQARVIIVAAILGLFIGWLYVVAAVPLYTARTDILIDAAKDKTEVSASIAELTIDTSAIESQVEVLKSEKIALGVVVAMTLAHDHDFMGERESLVRQAFNLLRSAFNAEGWLAAREKSQPEEEANLQRSAIARLQANVDVRRIPGTYVLSLYYTSSNRDKAAQIANGYADAYLNEQFEAKYDATRRAAGWLQTRLAELKQSSLDSDFAIQKFKADKGIVVTGGDKAPALMSDQQLTELNGQMVEAHADTAKAEARYAQIEDLLKSGRVGATVPDSLSNPIITGIREKYLAASKLEGQLEAKLGSGHQLVINLKKSMQDYENLITEELQRIAESYRSDAEVARSKEKSLNVSMSGLVGINAQTNQTLVQLRQLEREADTYRNLYQTFMQRYQEALQQQSFPVTQARVITPAWPPGGPSYPKQQKILLLSLVFGVMTGSAAAALREHRDRVFRVASQVHDELGLELLGILPIVDRSTNLKAAIGVNMDPTQVHATDALQCYSLDHPLSSFSEALRAAKVAIDLALGDRSAKVVGVISALPDEGKSTVAKNLASLLAHFGARTMLIDADLRNPGLTRGIAGHADAGILEAIQGDRPVHDLLLSEADSGLFVLPAVVRKQVQHTSEIISSVGMRNVLSQAGETFDYIVVDLPPLGPIVDARAVASMIDAFVVVVEWGRTSRTMVRNVLASDSSIHDKCIGVLFNKVNLGRLKLYEDHGSKEYYYSHYTKYYHKDLT